MNENWPEDFKLVQLQSPAALDPCWESAPWKSPLGSTLVVEKPILCSLHYQWIQYFHFPGLSPQVHSHSHWSDQIPCRTQLILQVPDSNGERDSGSCGSQWPVLPRVKHSLHLDFSWFPMHTVSHVVALCPVWLLDRDYIGLGSWVWCHSSCLYNLVVIWFLLKLSKDNWEMHSNFPTLGFTVPYTLDQSDVVFDLWFVCTKIHHGVTWNVGFLSPPFLIFLCCISFCGHWEPQWFFFSFFLFSFPKLFWESSIKSQ